MYCGHSCLFVLTSNGIAPISLLGRTAVIVIHMHVVWLYYKPILNVNIPPASNCVENGGDNSGH